MTGRSATTDDDAPPTRSAPSRRPTRARWPGTRWPPPTSPTSSTPTGCSWTATTSRRSRASWRSSATGSSPASCAATTSSCSAATWCATCCPSAGTVSRCPRCSTSSRTTACVPGPPRPTTGCTCPRRRRRQPCARRSSPRRPGSPSRGRRRRTRPGARAVRSVSSSSTRAGTRPPRPTPAPRGSQGVKGDDELNGPDLRPYAGHGTFIAGVVRCVAPETRVYVEGFAIGGVGGGGILESDLVVQLEQALRHDPQVINLSAGCRTRRDRPSIPLRKFHRRHLEERDCVLVAAAGNDSWAAPFWPAAFDWCVGVGSLDRDGRVSLVLQLRGLRRRLRAGAQPGQRVPRRHVRVQRDAGQGRHPGLQHRHGAVERHVVLSAGRGRPHRPRDQRDGRVGTRTRATPCWAAPGPDSDPTIGPHQELRQPYPHP